MKKILHLFIMLSIFLTVSAAADPATDLNALMTPIHTLSANFAQTVFDTKGRTIQHSSGKMALSRPGKFRWVVTKPELQTIIANGNKLWIYDPDLQQVTIRNINQSAADSPALLLSNESTSLENHYTVQESTANKLHWFKLLPKKKDNSFDWIQLGFAGTQISEMKLQDNLGHTTQIVFQNVKTNADLANSLFNFKAPANVDVLDETHKRQ